MTFIEFARAHGILIDALPPLGVWKRYPTTDKTQRKNGAVKYMGDHGHVQNHATQTEVATWKADNDKPIDTKALAARAKKVQADIAAGQAKAAEKAGWILSQCELATHPYLAKKGFPDHQALVWTRNDAKLLVIPMRVEKSLVGCQIISEDGTKKFLAGQRTSDAAFVMDAKGPPVLCEGMATALSVQAALAALKRRYRLYVCFSAHNLGRLAKTLPSGLIVADNDASGTGEKVAKETGWPYFMAPTIGFDFNDYHMATSLFKCSQSLRSVTNHVQ